MSEENNLGSSLNELGEYHNKIIHFVGGVKRTFIDIESKSIRQGQFTKMMTKQGNLILVNDANVLCIEVFPKEDSQTNEETKK